MSVEIIAYTAPVIGEIAWKIIKKYWEEYKAKDNLKDESHKIKPVFGDFVTRNDGFSNELINLHNIVNSYASRRDAKRPLNILLAAEPGNGKSFLINQLADSITSSIKVDFEEFHVVSFSSMSDLHGVFQRIQSANLNGKLPFILFDEVDGKVKDKNIFANLLAPMWDGVFYDGKEKFTLGKAVLFFAGSAIVPPPTLDIVLKSVPDSTPRPIDYRLYADIWRNIAEEAIKNDGKIEKCKDFIDRVDVMLCIPPVNAELTGDLAALEQVDIACLLVKKHFSKIERIEKSVLMVLLQKLTESTSRRPAEKCIFCANHPSDNTFKFSNLSKSEQNRYIENPNINEFMGQFIRFEITKDH
jgi:hypothetical protein